MPSRSLSDATSDADAATSQGYSTSDSDPTESDSDFNAIVSGCIARTYLVAIYTKEVATSCSPSPGKSRHAIRNNDRKHELQKVHEI